MGIFKKGKKKQEAMSCCCSGECGHETTATPEDAEIKGLSIKILGSGCAKCNKLEAATKAALEQLGLDTSIEHVSDFTKIAAHGVMTTPALVVDGKVASYGKVLKVEEVVQLLQKKQDSVIFPGYVSSSCGQISSCTKQFYA